MDKVEKQFIEETEKHIIKVESVEPLIISFKEPDTVVMGIKIIVYGTRLFYFGDMGDFVFKFSCDTPLPYFNQKVINPTYWEGKVSAMDDSIDSYIIENVFKEIRETGRFKIAGIPHIDSHMEDLEELLEDVQEDSLDPVAGLMDNIYSDNFWGKYLDEDYYPNKTYSYRYLWACYALKKIANYYFESEHFKASL